MHSQSSHPAHTQLPNNLHLWERDQQQHRDFLHQWTVCSTMANRALSRTWCTILKTKRQNTYKCPLGQQSCLDAKYEHRPSQNQGMRQHTVERIEKRTAKINGAKIEGTNA